MPAAEAVEDDGEPCSMMFRRLVLCSDVDRAARLSGDNVEGLGPVADGEDLGSQASSSPEKDGGPSLLKSLLPGLVRLRFARLKGSVNCVAETMVSNV